MSNASPAQRKRSQLQLLAVAAVCIAPVAVSYWMFFASAPARHTNYGELLETRALPAAELRLIDGSPFSLAQLRGKWVLLMVDSGQCDEFCRTKLYNLRQLRLTQGKDMDRIERAWLINDGAAPASTLSEEYAGTWFVRAAGSPLLRELPAPTTPVDHLYLIDPLGNLVLRYPRDAEPRRIIKDLSRLLRVSRIG